MNKSILILFFVIGAFKAFCQDKADSLFTKGTMHYKEGDFLEAINYFKEVVIHYKDFLYYDQVVFNLALTFNQIPDSLDQAIVWYEIVRASNVKDDEIVGGRGIFEPYANYKYYSTFNIASIEYGRGNYEKALGYYRQCMVKYPYYNNSGTSLRINKNRLIVYAVDCLVELKKYDEALAVILPEVLDSYGSSNYRMVVKRAIELIVNYHNKEKIATELEAALHTIKQNGSKYQFTFIWRDSTGDLFPYLVGNDFTVDTFITEIKETDFWRLLVY